MYDVLLYFALLTPTQVDVVDALIKRKTGNIVKLMVNKILGTIFVIPCATVNTNIRIE